MAYSVNKKFRLCLPKFDLDRDTIKLEIYLSLRDLLKQKTIFLALVFKSL